MACVEARCNVPERAAVILGVCICDVVGDDAGDVTICLTSRINFILSEHC